MLAPVLLELALLFALCVGVAVAFHRLRLPPLVGFLVTGAFVGPNSLAIVQHEATVREVADVGVVVLMFMVGMQIPIHQIGRLRRAVGIAGGLQLGVTSVLAALFCMLAGLSWNQALFLGFLLTQSSTASTTKLLMDHGEVTSPHGRMVMGINIAQDLGIVPMILLLPLLGGGGGSEPVGFLGALKNLLLLAGVIALARVLLPLILGIVSRTRSRDLFVLTIATVCLALAVATAGFGLSLALGALLAGMLLADTEYYGQAVAEVEPFRDALASLFFVSIGMLFDYRTILSAPGLVLVALVAVWLGKAAVVVLAVRLAGQPTWVGVRAGLLMANVGEASFVIMQVGAGGGLLDASVERIFYVVAVLSMASAPLLDVFGRWYVARSRERGGGPRPSGGDKLQNHAIVVGYGPTGRTVVQGLTALGIPVVVAEMNAATVREEKNRGVPIHLGDATRLPVLRSLGIERARIVVVAVNDTGACRRIAQLARQVAPQAHVTARAVYIAEVESLQRAGAHEVVPQELEASVEILVRVLRRFLVPDDEIGRQVRAVRAAAGGITRQAEVAPAEVDRIAEFVPGIGVQVFRVAEGAVVCGRTLTEVGVRRHTGCSVVAVRRGGHNLDAVTPETALEAGDFVVVIGPQSRLDDAAAMFHAREGETRRAAGGSGQG